MVAGEADGPSSSATDAGRMDRPMPVRLKLANSAGWQARQAPSPTYETSGAAFKYSRGRSCPVIESLHINAIHSRETRQTSSPSVRRMSRLFTAESQWPRVPCTVELPFYAPRVSGRTSEPRGHGDSPTNPSGSSRIRLTWLDYPDPVISERVVRAPDFVLRHVAVDAVLCSHLARRSVRR